MRVLLLCILLIASSCTPNVTAPYTNERVYMGPKAEAFSEADILSSIENVTPVKPDIGSLPKNKKRLEQVFQILKDRNKAVCAVMVDHTHLKDCNWLHLNGQDLPSVNAFPWGDQYIYVSDSLLMYLEDDDELAFLLAHEMGHQLAEHVTENLPKVTVSFNVVGDTTRFLLCGVCVLYKPSASANYAEVVAEQNKLFGQMTDSFFDLDQEREADYIALYLMVNAGFDVETGLNFFYKMAALNPVSGEKLKHKAQYFDTHAFSVRRIARMKAVLREINEKIRTGNVLLPNATEVQ